MADQPPHTALPSWINKGTNALPDWLLPHMNGKRDANGCLMIKTMAGSEKVQARVLVGHIVLLRKGVAYTRWPNEARAFVQELDEKDSGAYAQLPKTDSRPVAAVADVADRSDDTDEITRRIRAAKPAPAPRSTSSPAAAVPKRKSRFAAAIGLPPSIENRHTSELKIDDNYQRSIDTGPSKTLIKRIAEGWDWRMFQPLTVSRREDGSLYVIDGQHRQAAAKMRGDIPFLPCCIATYASVADEAAMFVAMNRSRRSMNRLDDFHAAQAGGDTLANGIAEMIASVGFTVSRRTGAASWVAGEVAFTSAITTVVRKHGQPIAREALQMMADAFPNERLVAGSSVFTALCRVLITPPDPFDRERLCKALLTFDMKGWASFLTKSRGGLERSQRLREMLLMAYDDAEKVPT